MQLYILYKNLGLQEQIFYNKSKFKKMLNIDYNKGKVIPRGDVADHPELFMLWYLWLIIRFPDQWYSYKFVCSSRDSLVSKFLLGAHKFFWFLRRANTSCT